MALWPMRSVSGLQTRELPKQQVHPLWDSAIFYCHDRPVSFRSFPLKLYPISSHLSCAPLGVAQPSTLLRGHKPREGRASNRALPVWRPPRQRHGPCVSILWRKPTCNPPPHEEQRRSRQHIPWERRRDAGYAPGHHRTPKVSQASSPDRCSWDDSWSGY